MDWGVVDIKARISGSRAFFRLIFVEYLLGRHQAGFFELGNVNKNLLSCPTENIKKCANSLNVRQNVVSVSRALIG